MELDLRNGYGELVPATIWHRGDRCLVRESGQHAIVEGWKGTLLLVNYGHANGRDYREWVPEAGCDWVPPPRNSSGGTKVLDVGGR